MPVNGDNLHEPDETFFVILHSPTNATISHAQGIGTIINDDPPPDTTAPTVTTTIPQAGAKGVSRTTTVKANFSEAVQASTLTSENVQLFWGNSTKPLKATLSKTSDSVTLTPSQRLDAKNSYRAVVSTGVKDLEGNALDQDPNVTDNQPKQWTFITGAQ